MRTDQTMSASRVATVLLRVGGPVLSTGGRARDAAPRSARRRRRSPSVQALESRLLMHAGCDHDHGELGELIAEELLEGMTGPLTSEVGDPVAGSSGTTSASPVLVAEGLPLTSIPVLHSLPGSTKFLYLDFDGDYQAQWGTYGSITTPAYDQDGDAGSFSDGELTSIRNIWRQVAEDYAPFQIDVTTEQPASLAPGTTMKVVVGGGGAWTGGTYGGIAYVGSFRTGPNVAFVFPANLGGGYAKYVGDASSHEAGHGFGLKHQSSYNSSGIKTADYSTGPGDGTAPLMGNSYSPRRSLWWYGPTTSVSTFQNDLSVISSTNNGFGYRSDEAGDSASTAAPLTLSGTSASASGIITTMSDLDYYSFSTDPGTVTFTVTVPASVSNLSPKLELRGADGATLIASAGPIATDFSASISVSLPAGGSYRLVVASNGRSSSSTTSNYGFNVGQYSLSGTIVTSAGAISTPTGLTATNITTTCIDLSWTDNAGNETGYRVERSSNGTTWSQLGGDLPANTVSYSDTSASAGTTYSYRVRAFNASATSSYSALATATTVPLAPANLIGTAAASNRVDLSWTDVTGETGYLVERSLDGTTWSQVGTVGQGVTSYSDSSVSPNTAYRYRARAANAGGSSDPSNQVTVTTPAASQALAAPSNLQATAVTRSRVDLTWTDNSSDETGFRIERSTTNGRSWSLIATVGRDVTSYSNTTVSRNRTYSYRVRAYKGTTYSAYSNVVVVTTPSASTSNAPLNEGLAILSPTGGEARWSAAASTVASPRLLAVDEALAAWDAQMGGLTAIATMGAKRARK